MLLYSHVFSPLGLDLHSKRSYSDQFVRRGQPSCPDPARRREWIALNPGAGTGPGSRDKKNGSIPVSHWLVPYSNIIDRGIMQDQQVLGIMSQRIVRVFTMGPLVAMGNWIISIRLI
jgi:hypothetical protein